MLLKETGLTAQDIKDKVRNSVGNCNKAVVEAVREQVGEIMQTFNYPYTIPQALLAEKICTSIGMDKTAADIITKPFQVLDHLHRSPLVKGDLLYVKLLPQTYPSL